jgi:drug/metabolite transporter (DMT)-like permease
MILGQGMEPRQIVGALIVVGAVILIGAKKH